MADKLSLTSHKWSPLQEKIYDFAENDTGNCIIYAAAGSGKSTTLKETVKRLTGSSIFLAFNKDIVEALKAAGVNAATFHSVCYRAILSQGFVLDDDKIYKIIKANFSFAENKLYGKFVRELIGFAKNEGVGCLVDDVEQTWMDIIDHQDLELESETATYPEAIRLARKVLQISNESRFIDFNDMIYLVVKNGIPLQKYDNVLVDECQDTNPVRRAIIKKLLKPRGRLFAVGDENQAIYGWVGASSNAMSLIEKDYNCKKFPLSISYRCGKKIVEYAKNFCSEIEAAPTAHDGEVLHLDTNWKVTDFKINDMILCRTTAPIVQLAYRLLRNRIPAYVKGKEIGSGLKSLIKRMNAKDLDKLKEKLKTYREREIEKAKINDEDKKIQNIKDKTDTIFFLIDILNEDDRSIDGLTKTIDELFQDRKNAVTLSTIHKAKGLEADTVYWLNRSLCPGPWAKQDWQRAEERHIMYVAATRAKNKLVLIEDGNSRNDE